MYEIKTDRIYPLLYYSMLIELEQMLGSPISWKMQVLRLRLGNFLFVTFVYILFLWGIFHGIFMVFNVASLLEPPAQHHDFDEETHKNPRVDRGLWALKRLFDRESVPWDSGLAAAKQILLVTTWRSGSSFLGEILAKIPGTFYTYEPLVYFDKVNVSVEARGISKSRITTPKKVRLQVNSTSIKLLTDLLLSCEVTSDFLRIASQRKNRYLVYRNPRFWKVCSEWTRDKKSCYDPEFYRQLCLKFPLRVAKTVRLRAEETEELLEKIPNLKVRSKVKNLCIL